MKPPVQPQGQRNKVTVDFFASSIDGFTAKRPLQGALEDYDRRLAKYHHGWSKTLKSVIVEIPTDGDVGSRQGELAKEIRDGLTDVGTELENIQKPMENLNRDPYLLASLSASAASGEAGESTPGPSVLQTYTAPLHEMRNNLKNRI